MENSLLERIYRNLPKHFRNADEKQRLQLKRYLDILVSGGFKPLREETEGLLDLINIEKIPAKYLPHLASELGFVFPYDLDEQTQRTYIKNAVLSYRLKGTKDALAFMIRELTQFKTDLDIDEDNKTLEIRLEVDLERHDFLNYVEKVDFLVEEYAPPFKSFDLINTFLWNEEYFKDYDLETEGPITIQSSLLEGELDNWFVSNIGYTNDLERPTMAFNFEEYLKEDLGETIFLNDIVFTKPDEDEFIIDRMNLFISNESLTNEVDDNIIISSLLDESREVLINMDLDNEPFLAETRVFEEDIVTLKVPLEDFTSHPDWFITGIGLTNESVTAYGEFYEIETIKDELTGEWGISHSPLEEINSNNTRGAGEEFDSTIETIYFISDEIEDARLQFIDETISFTVYAPPSDLDYEPQWFGANRGTTNEHLTGEGETYFKEIFEEHDDVRITIEDEVVFDSSYMKIDKKQFTSNHSKTNDLDHVTAYREYDELIE